MLTCSHCKNSKANTKFAPDAKMRSGRSSWCKDCKKEYQREYAKLRRKEPDGRARKNDSARRSRLAWYGLTEADYDELLALQGGVCAGCGRPPSPDKRLAVDHRHQPGDKKREPWERASEVRGLLCYLCNRVVGILRDNPETFKKLATYLDAPPAVAVVLPKFERIIQYLKEYEERTKTA